MNSLITKIAILATTVVAGAATGCVNIGCGRDSPDEVPDDGAERFGEAMCDAYARCDCMSEVFADTASCRTEAAATFRRVKAWPGVTFDDSCFEDVLDFIQENNCAAPPKAEPFPCEVFKGTEPRGSTCKAEWSFDDP